MILRILAFLASLPVALIAYGYCKGYHHGYRFRTRQERHETGRYVLTADGIQESHYHDHSAL